MDLSPTTNMKEKEIYTNTTEQLFPGNGKTEDLYLEISPTSLVTHTPEKSSIVDSDMEKENS